MYESQSKDGTFPYTEKASKQLKKEAIIVDLKDARFNSALL
jgi:hypothetical protein